MGLRVPDPSHVYQVCVAHLGISIIDDDHDNDDHDGDDDDDDDDDHDNDNNDDDDNDDDVEVSSDASRSHRSSSLLAIRPQAASHPSHLLIILIFSYHSYLIFKSFLSFLIVLILSYHSYLFLSF